MDLPATQAIDDEDFVPTQKCVTNDKEREKSLIGTLVISDKQQHPIFSGITTIGRQPDCTVVLNDETVSKRHAEIEAESPDKAVFIKDLESSNKTKINDTRLRANCSYQIRDNDKLTFGKVIAVFKVHQLVNDSFVSCTPQVNRKLKEVIPDTPDSSMDSSFVLKVDVSTISETQADEDDPCFRRPQIPVRTSTSNENESLKPFTIDDVASALSNSKGDNDISEVETQRFIVNNIKEVTDNSIYTVETQKVIMSEKCSVHSHGNEDYKRSLNNSFVKKVLSEEFEDQSLEDMETQELAHAKSNSSSKRSEDTSIYNAETQEILPSAREDQPIENAEIQSFIPVKSDVDKSNLADLSIHNAATQKIVSEKELIENLDTQPFNRNSVSSDRRKSANTSIYSAKTQKVVSDVCNQSFDDIETQKFTNNADCSTLKSADVSIYSAATQKNEPTSENGAIENLETQKFESTRVSLNSDSHQIVNQEKMVSSLRLSNQDIDTMPFTEYELPLDEKSNDVGVQNDILLDSAANTTKSENDKEVQANETLSKSMSKNLLQISSKFDQSKSLVESDDEEEIFSQNLIENCPFRQLLDDSKNDDNEKSTAVLQNDKELGIEKIVNSDHNISSGKEDNSADNENSIKNTSTIAENNDSETDEEGVFSTNSPKGNENQKLREKTGNDSETDEEGVFSNHVAEEEGEKLNNKPESDSETDEEGVFSGHFSKDSKQGKSNNNNKIIDESESEDEGIFSNNQSKNKASKGIVDPDENIKEVAGDSSFVSKSIEKVIPLSPKIEHSLDQPNEIVQRESPVPESDDDIFENDEEKRTSSSYSDKMNGSAIDKENDDLRHNSSKSNTTGSELGKTVNDNKDVDDLAPTQILETDLSLAPTQIIHTNQASNLEKERSEEVDELPPTQLIETENLPLGTVRSEEVDELAPTQRIETENLPLVTEKSEEIDELAPTQLIETQSVPIDTENAFLMPARKAATVTDAMKKVAQTNGETNLAPTQKLEETQECTESLAPTQKVVDSQLYTEEMGILQFTESMDPTPIIESKSNDVEDEISTSPKISTNTPKRQIEELEITSNKKLKTSEALPTIDADLNSTVEQNLNEMFEGSEEKIVNDELPIETQQLANILESSQIEENSAAALDVSINKPSPTLSDKRSNVRGKNRRRILSLNKSGALNETNKSIVNLNETIEKNLNELFDNSVDNIETHEPEPMLTQQLENVLSSSQNSEPVERKEEGRTLDVSRRKSRLSLSMNLNNSILKTPKEKEKYSSNVQSISKEAEATSPSNLNHKSPQNEDYSANLEKDNPINEQITSINDKDIVYRRGTIGFTDDLKPVSRDSKTTATTTASRMSGSTSTRTKRISVNDDVDDAPSHQPSPKRTKTLTERQKLQQVTVVISPLGDRLIKLRDAKGLNAANAPSNLEQSDAALEKKRGARAPKTLGNHAILSNAGRIDLSAVESSIVEDKSNSRSKPKTRGRQAAARNKKAKVDTSSERSANSSKENLEESDVQKPKTRGRGARNQTTDSSASRKDSSKDQISASSVESKSARPSRSRLARQNQTKKEDAKAAVKNSKVVQDSESEISEAPKTIVRKNTRDRLAKTVDKSVPIKIDVAQSKIDKNQDKQDTKSQSSSQSESVTVRTTRTRKNNVKQESDSGSSKTHEVANTRGSKRKPASNKPDLVLKLMEVDSNEQTVPENNATKDDVNVFKLMKKKMNAKPEEPTAASTRKTRTRATKNPTVVEERSLKDSKKITGKTSDSENSKTTTRRRGHPIKSYTGNTESSDDDIFEKPAAKSKRARITKADKTKSLHVSDTKDDLMQSSQKSTRRKRSPSPSPLPSSDATLTPSRISRLSLSPTKKPKVLFTGEKSEAHRQILTKLGGIETEEFNSCSVLITDKVRRTFKFLCSLSRGIPIASVKWLDESKKANHFLDLEEYILNDPEAEAKFKFNLKESLDKARKHKLLEGYTIVLAPKIKQPPITELKEMVTSSGGKPLVRAPAKWSEKSVVVTTEQELDSAKKLIAKAPKSVTVQSIEFILTGILRQDVNFDEFKLLN